MEKYEVGLWQEERWPVYELDLPYEHDIPPDTWVVLSQQEIDQIRYAHKLFDEAQDLIKERLSERNA